MGNKFNHNGTLIRWLNFIASILLLIYPFVLMANIMTLGGNRSDDTPFIILVVSYGFIVFSTLYPVTWYIGVKKNKRKKLSIAVLPFIHILICGTLFLLWMNFGG